jgi:Fe-S cluster assembly ATP-binding protein
MLEIQDLHVAIDKKEILKGINLTIPDHEVHALFGPNGCGKSVFISTIMGYPEFKITGGKIYFNQKCINDLSIDERVKLGIGAMEQRPPTVRGVKLGTLAEMILQMKGETLQGISEISKRYEMDRFFDREINDGFSGGEIKKSEMFLLMIANPSFVILDEPDSGVDPEQLKTIGNMINQSLHITELPGERCKTGDRSSSIIATHSAAILDYVQTDKAHVMIDGQIKCSGNSLLLMNQIRGYGYDYCVKCQQSIDNNEKK